MQLHANGIVESIISKLHLTKHNGLDKNQILLRDYELHELKAVLIEQVEDVYFKTRMSDLYPTTISVSVFTQKVEVLENNLLKNEFKSTTQIIDVYGNV